MAIPPTATKMGRILDPSDKKEEVLNCALILEPGERIASYTITLSAASLAAGMTIANSGGRQPALINEDTAIRIWALMDPSQAENVVFDGVGITLDGKLHIVTDSSPSREDEQTFLIQWAQK